MSYWALEITLEDRNWIAWVPFGQKVTAEQALEYYFRDHPKLHARLVDIGEILSKYQGSQWLAAGECGEALAKAAQENVELRRRISELESALEEL